MSETQCLFFPQSTAALSYWKSTSAENSRDQDNDKLDALYLPSNLFAGNIKLADSTASILQSYLLAFQSLAVSLRTTRFNIQQFYVVPALLWVFGTDLRTDSGLCLILH
jgi:hypothetical protein